MKNLERELVEKFPSEKSTAICVSISFKIKKIRPQNFYLLRNKNG